MVDTQHNLHSTFDEACRAGRDPYETLGIEFIATVLKNAEPQNSIKFLVPELVARAPVSRYKLVPHLTTRRLTEPLSVISELTVTDDAQRFVMSIVCSGASRTDRVWVRWVEDKALPDRKCRFLCDRILTLDADPTFINTCLGEVRQVVKSALKIK